VTDLLNIVAVGILLGGIYALVSVGLNLIFGVIRIVNFAQGEFVMLGMYGAYAAYAFLRLDPYLALFVLVPAMFVFGAAVQRLILAPLRTEPSMQIFATFGLLMLIENVVLALTRGTALSVPSTVGQASVGILGLQVGLARLVALAAATACAAGLGLFLRHTMTGRAIRAVAQDRAAATLMGVNVERVYMVTFGIGTAIAGLAGCLLAPIYTLSPQIGTSFILPAFAVVVLGGLGSVLGAYVGGFVVGMTEAFAGYYLDPALKYAVLFGVFILVLLVRPSGLFGKVGAEDVGLRDQA
jgi:branched-chain amino acid transport system permease protein